MAHSAFVPSALWTLPFAGLLVGLAVLPLVAHRFWESNVRKLVFCAALAAPVLVLYLIHSPTAVVHAGEEYLSFIVLLGGLFFIAGGVLLEGDLEATPSTNTLFLALGVALAGLIGTTGASMLLIRPLLSTNKERRHVVHTAVFFIFLVSNIGGCLLPLGDPPLFMGYLRGVPFTWTLGLWPQWLMASSILLVVYFVWDTILHQKEPPERIRLDRTNIKPLHVGGAHNLALLAAVAAVTVLLATPWRELATVVLAVLSWRLTSPHLYHANRFSFHPMLEVAAIFFGIFVTMLPALDVLHARGAELSLHQPWQYFWATGLLSTFLDNTPTYLTFLALGQSQQLGNEVVGVPHNILAAISLGSVFMGANSYLGNGPNFMVRAIAESRGIRMPSFGGFMVYSGAVVLPVFVLITVIFF